MRRLHAIAALLLLGAGGQALAQGGFGVSEGDGRVTLTTPRVSAEVDLASGNVSFRDETGSVVLAESAPASFAPVEVEGQRYVSVRQQFNRGTDEGLFGLGQHQNGQMNYNGEDVELAQHNIAVSVPFLVSTRNYGLLWDNNSITRFGKAERRLHRAPPQRPAAGRAPPLRLLRLRRCPGGRLLFHRRRRHGRRDRRLSPAHRPRPDHAALGLRLLAEPPALWNAGATSRRRARISAARAAARQHRAGLVLLARERLGESSLRSGAVPEPAGDGGRSPPAERPDDDLGLAEILSGDRQLPRAGRGQAGGWTITWPGTGITNEDFPNAQAIYAGIRETVRAGGGTATLSAEGRYTGRRPDVAIVVFGEEPYAEFVGDRQTLEFSPSDRRHYELMQRLRAEGIPVVAVFLSGRPMWVNPEINASDAFVAAFLPGSEGGGVADVLFAARDGRPRHDFRGRLSYSWPRRADQTPLNRGDAITIRSSPTASGCPTARTAISPRSPRSGRRRRRRVRTVCCSGAARFRRAGV